MCFVTSDIQRSWKCDSLRPHSPLALTLLTASSHLHHCMSIVLPGGTCSLESKGFSCIPTAQVSQETGPDAKLCCAATSSCLRGLSCHVTPVPRIQDSVKDGTCVCSS